MIPSEDEDEEQNITALIHQIAAGHSTPLSELRAIAQWKKVRDHFITPTTGNTQEALKALLAKNKQKHSEYQLTIQLGFQLLYTIHSTNQIHTFIHHLKRGHVEQNIHQIDIAAQIFGNTQRVVQY